MAHFRNGKEIDYKQLDAVAMLKFIAHHRGSTGRQCKAMAMRWLGANNPKDTQNFLSPDGVKAALRAAREESEPGGD